MSPHKVTGLDMLLSLADSLGYPCVVKNNDSFRGLFGKKAVIAGTREELLKSVPAWPEREPGSWFCKNSRADSGTTAISWPTGAG